MRAGWLAAAVLLAWPGGEAAAGSVTVRNGAGEVIRGVHLAPAGSGAVGENRMRSQLPPGAEARITYSTGCRADVRLVYGSGRSEDHAGVDVCGDARIVAGTEGVAGPAMAAAAGTGTAPVASGAKGKVVTAVTSPALPAKAPPPVVPPWTGKSITKRFGGMD